MCFALLDKVTDKMIHMFEWVTIEDNGFEIQILGNLQFYVYSDVS